MPPPPPPPKSNKRKLADNDNDNGGDVKAPLQSRVASNWQENGVNDDAQPSNKRKSSRAYEGTKASPSTPLTLTLTGSTLTMDALVACARDSSMGVLASADSYERMRANRAFAETVAERGDVVYGTYLRRVCVFFSLLSSLNSHLSSLISLA